MERFLSSAPDLLMGVGLGCVAVYLLYLGWTGWRGADTDEGSGGARGGLLLFGSLGFVFGAMALGSLVAGYSVWVDRPSPRPSLADAVVATELERIRLLHGAHHTAGLPPATLVDAGVPAVLAPGRRCFFLPSAEAAYWRAGTLARKEGTSWVVEVGEKQVRVARSRLRPFAPPPPGLMLGVDARGNGTVVPARVVRWGADEVTVQLADQAEDQRMAPSALRLLIPPAGLPLLAAMKPGGVQLPATVVAAEEDGLVVDWFDPPELQNLYQQAQTKGWAHGRLVDRWGHVAYADTSFLSDGLAVRLVSALEGGDVAAVVRAVGSDSLELVLGDGAVKQVPWTRVFRPAASK